MLNYLTKKIKTLAKVASAKEYQLFHGVKQSYGDAGYFLKSNPITTKYTYANWGSRLWEYRYADEVLSESGLDGKRVVDMGIGLPEDSNFYKFYVNGGCELVAYDFDSRLQPVTRLSEKCRIIRGSSASMKEVESGSVDYAVAISNFEHYDSDSFDKTLSEVNRLLKSGGKFLVTFDIVDDHAKPAPWAILEKSINGQPAAESNAILGPNDKKLDLKSYLTILSKYFIVPQTIANENAPKSELLRSEKWNSRIGYAVVTKP